MTSYEFSTYIEGLKGEPFCLIYASHEPHAPHMEGRITANDVSVPPHWLDTWESRDLLARYMNDVEAMDSEFGKLMEVLKDNELYQDAVVLFWQAQESLQWPLQQRTV